MRLLKDIDIKEKTLLMRFDFNVPIENGRIVSDARIVAALETIKYAIANNAKLLLMSHLGRPQEGIFEERFSLQPVADYLTAALGQKVPLINNYLDEKPQLSFGEVAMLENVRFNRGESSNDAQLSAKYAALCDIFVSDGFGVVHRAQASTCGVAEKAACSCAGFLIAREVAMLDKIMRQPQKPYLAIVGGAKVSSKLLILKKLVEKVDTLIPGGGIANTFLVAEGYNVGLSLYEPDLVNESKQLIAFARQRGVNIALPVDVIVADELSDTAQAIVKDIVDVADNEMILDVGPQTTQQFSEIISAMKTIVWNGPVGVFEKTPFARGTHQIGQAIADSAAFTFVGGGDTIAAIDMFGIADKIDYISTGGGSMLEYLEGKTLPGLAILE